MLILIHENGKIMIEKVHKISPMIKSEFKDLLKNSEKVAKRLWNNKQNEIWNKL